MEDSSPERKVERLYGKEALLKEIRDARVMLDHFEQLAGEGKFNSDEFAEDLGKKIKAFFEGIIENYGRRR